MKSLLKHSSIYSLTLFLARVISFAAFILFARRLGPTEFGRYVFFITIVQIITFIADSGLGQWYQKNVEGKNRHHFFAAAAVARLVTLAISVIGGSVVLAIFLGFDRALIAIFVVAMSFEAMLSIAEYFYFEKKQSHIVGIKQIGRALLLIIFYYTASHFFNFQIALIAYITSSLLTFLWFFPWRTVSHMRYHHITNSHRVLKASIPYALLSITSLAYARADSILIGIFKGNAAVGLYSAAYRFLEALSLVPQALSQNLFPISAKQVVSKQSLIALTATMFIVGSILSLSLFLAASFIITYFVGNSFQASIPILKILSVVLLLFFINAPLATTIQSSHLVKNFLPYGIANTLLNVTLNIIFIPLYGVMAAAWVMLLTEVSGLVINSYFTYKIYGK